MSNRASKITTIKRTNISVTNDTDSKAKALEAADRRTRSGLFAVLVDGEFERRFGKRRVAA